MQAREIESVREVLSKASRRIESITGSKVVAFILNEKSEQKKITDTLEQLKGAILQMYDLTWAELTGKKQVQHNVFARHLFSYYALDVMRMGVSQVGRLLNRDHTTAIHGRNKIRDFISIKDAFTLVQLNTLKMYLEFEPETHEI